MFAKMVAEIFYTRIIKGFGKIAPSILSGEKVIYGARDVNGIGETDRLLVQTTELAEC